jgi:phosphoribosylglycinamide formyltransferase-1
MEKIKVAVLVSGGGTNLGALIEAERKGIIKSGKLSLVISNKVGAYALERAKAADIEALTVTKAECGSQEAFEERLIAELQSRDIELIVLAGFMAILSEKFTRTFDGRIINVHPSLIPSFCGKGFYGLRVHEAALEYGVKVTGATVHYVNEIPDGGKIILQKSVSIKTADTPEILQRRVMEKAEWIILPKACELVSKRLLSERAGKC